MKKYSIIFILLLAIVAGKAQTNLEMADEAFTAKEYTAALDYYQKVLKKPSKKH